MNKSLCCKQVKTKFMLKNMFLRKMKMRQHSHWIRGRNHETVYASCVTLTSSREYSIFMVWSLPIGMKTVNAEMLNRELDLFLNNFNLLSY